MGELWRTKAFENRFPVVLGAANGRRLKGRGRRPRLDHPRLPVTCHPGRRRLRHGLQPGPHWRGPGKADAPGHRSRNRPHGELAVGVLGCRGEQVFQARSPLARVLHEHQTPPSPERIRSAGPCTRVLGVRRDPLARGGLIYFGRGRDHPTSRRWRSTEDQ